MEDKDIQAYHKWLKAYRNVYFGKGLLTGVITMWVIYIVFKVIGWE